MSLLKCLLALNTWSGNYLGYKLDDSIYFLARLIEIDGSQQAHESNSVGIFSDEFYTEPLMTSELKEFSLPDLGKIKRDI